ncbi:hypothetical protein [Falsiroseomonas sp.]
MNRNLLLIVIGVLGVLAGGVGYWLYAEQQKSGVEINVGPSGVSIQER